MILQIYLKFFILSEISINSTKNSSNKVLIHYRLYYLAFLFNFFLLFLFLILDCLQNHFLLLNQFRYYYHYPNLYLFIFDKQKF